MARTKKRRVEGPKQAPRPERERDGKQQLKQQASRRDQRRAAKQQPKPIEDTLFFSRLRKQAKWVFVLLALAFAATFVVFGVGSGGSGLGDVLFLDDAGGGDAVSIEEAQDKIDKNPDNAQAYYELAQAYQIEGQTDNAVDALVQYTALRPKDREKLEELAGLYLQQGQQAEQGAQVAQLESQQVTGGGVFTPQLKGAGGQSVDLGVGTGVEDAVTSESSEKFNEYFQAMSSAYSKAQATYEQVAEIAPDDPAVFQNLAIAAQQANDIDAAIEAYDKFLELAPDDPSAVIVRQQLKQLRAQQKAQQQITSAASPGG